MNLFDKPAPRLEPLPPDPGLDDVFSRFNCVGAMIPNAILVMQRMPKILHAYVQMMAAISDPATSEVDIGLKRLIAHVSSRAAGCKYCMSHTAALALGSGIKDTKLSAVWEYRTNVLYSDAERIALDVAFAAGGVPNEVTDEMFANLREHWTDGPDCRDRRDGRAVWVSQPLERHLRDASRGRGARDGSEVPWATRLGCRQTFEARMKLGRFNFTLGFVAMCRATRRGFSAIFLNRGQFP